MDFSRVKDLLSKPANILITSHFKPDGDAMGSSLGLGMALKKMGHKIQVIVPSDYPEFLHWLPGNEEVIIYNEEVEEHKEIIKNSDIIFTLDFNDLSRIKALAVPVKASSATKIMIDHHLKPSDYADEMMSDSSASSTCAMIVEFLREIGQEDLIDQDIAVCLYTGLATDTGLFRYSVSDPKVHQIAANLIEKGADIDLAHDKIFNSFREDRLRLFGFCLSERMEIMMEYHTGLIYVSEADYNRFNFQTGDNEGLVNYPLSIKGIKFVALISESDGVVKLSLRSKGDFPTNEFAEKNFQGGGHKNASGGKSYLSLKATVDKFKRLLPEYAELLKA